MKKISLGIITLVTLVLILCFSCFADGEWVTEGSNKKYKEDGQFVVSDWKHIKIDDTNYSYFYFDENGNMVTGLTKIGDSIYSFNDDGTTNTNNKVTIDGEEYPTKNKGLVEGLPADFDIAAYYVRYAAEKEAEKQQIAANAQFKQEYDASVKEQESINASRAAEEKIKADKVKAESMAAAQAENAYRAKNLITMKRGVADEIRTDTHDGGRITFKYLYPELTGGKADTVNAVLKTKLEDLLTKRIRNEYSEVTTKKEIKFKNVSVNHDLTINKLTITLYDSLESENIKVYVNVDTLEFTDSGDLKE